MIFNKVNNPQNKGRQQLTDTEKAGYQPALSYTLAFRGTIS